MFFIKENKDGDLEIYFEFYVIDKKRKKCQCFNSSPTVVITKNRIITNQQINKEAVLLLREKMERCLRDLEFCVKNQTDKEYLLRIEAEATRKPAYEMTSYSEW